MTKHHLKNLVFISVFLPCWLVKIVLGDSHIATNYLMGTSTCANPFDTLSPWKWKNCSGPFKEIYADCVGFSPSGGGHVFTERQQLIGWTLP